MPRGVYDRNKKMAVENPAQSGNVTLKAMEVPGLGSVPFVAFEPDKAPAQEPVKMFPVKLLYNYRPFGEFTPVGWHKPAVEKKNAAGQMIIVEPAEFVEGEIKPAPYPGVGFPGKVWAGSVIGLPRDEAIVLINSRRAERADAIPA